MYKLKIKPTADRIFKRLAKKDKEQLRRINRKIRQILEEPYHFKPLRKPLDGLRRAQVGSFVIVYEIQEKGNIIEICYYDHHDNIYE